MVFQTDVASGYLLMRIKQSVVRHACDVTQWIVERLTAIIKERNVVSRIQYSFWRELQHKIRNLEAT